MIYKIIIYYANNCYYLQLLCDVGFIGSAVQVWEFCAQECAPLSTRMLILEHKLFWPKIPMVQACRHLGQSWMQNEVIHCGWSCASRAFWSVLSCHQSPTVVLFPCWLIPPSAVQTGGFRDSGRLCTESARGMKVKVWCFEAEKEQTNEVCLENFVPFLIWPPTSYPVWEVSLSLSLVVAKCKTQGRIFIFASSFPIIQAYVCQQSEGSN